MKFFLDENIPLSINNTIKNLDLFFHGGSHLLPLATYMVAWVNKDY